MKPIRAILNWSKVCVRIVGYGSVSCLLGPLTKKHGASNWAYRRWSASVCDALGIRRTLHGAEHLAGVEQCVFIANHLSLTDIIVVGSLIQHDFRWLAKDAVFRLPFVGWHMRLAGHIPVHRKKTEANKQIPERVHKVVGDGASLFFFPEGTRSPDGRLQPFKPGAFMSAVVEELPVVPLVIRGTGELMRWDPLESTCRHASLSIL